MVLISKEERQAVYQYLLREGTLVVKKDVALEKHQDIQLVANLKVMMICKTLKSKGHLAEKFNWQWYYFNLTEDGIRAMCEYLGLPTNIRPDYYKAPAVKRNVTDEERPRRSGFGRGGRGRPKEE
jgi:small subunit ribosomal protein S10e